MVAEIRSGMEMEIKRSLLADTLFWLSAYFMQRDIGGISGSEQQLSIS